MPKVERARTSKKKPWNSIWSSKSTGFQGVLNLANHLLFCKPKAYKQNLLQVPLFTREHAHSSAPLCETENARSKGRRGPAPHRKDILRCLGRIIRIHAGGPELYPCLGAGLTVSSAGQIIGSSGCLKSLLFIKIESERFGPKVLCCCRAQMKTRARSFSCKTRSCGLQERTRLSPPRAVITMTLHHGLAKGTACRTCPLAVLLQVSFSYPGSRTEAH